MRASTQVVQIMKPESGVLRAARAATLSLLAALALAGCGGGVSAAKSGGAAADGAPRDEAPLTDQASALREIGRAEGQLTALFGPLEEASPALTPPQGTAQSAPEAVTTATGGASPPSAEPRAAQAAERPATDPCQIACRALASMARAANHLCGLSGESDASCTSARERVNRANARVSASCGCGG